MHFARRCRHVIGVDNCLPRLELAQQNARVYGVAGRLDLLCADYFDLRDQLKACAFLGMIVCDDIQGHKLYIRIPQANL